LTRLRPASTDQTLERLRALSLALPEAWEKISHGEPTFWVQKRMFATFANANNHHGAGRDAVWCKASHMTQQMVVSRWPDRYFVPPYVGTSGWFGIYLDRRPNWREVADRLEGSYRLVAPRRLLAALDGEAVKTTHGHAARVPASRRG
jgi:hypothetical protein